jgi:carboxymethylenebutenolidase
MPRKDIDIKTADGSAKAGLFLPNTRPEPVRSGVVVYMDAFGPRPALDEMAERLADLGHAVLVPDLFYRHGSYGPFDAKTAFSDERTATQIRKMMAETTQAMSEVDTGAFLDVLADEGVERFGLVGYCMGGARALNAAARHAGRILAAASFHGGNLASDAPDSPHRRAAEIQARVYVGVAGVDKSFPPEQSARLAQALREVEVDHIIENYVGKSHGWAVPDHGVFDAEGAERHWSRLATLFRETLQN